MLARMEGVGERRQKVYIVDERTLTGPFVDYVNLQTTFANPSILPDTLISPSLCQQKSLVFDTAISMPSGSVQPSSTSTMSHS